MISIGSRVSVINGPLRGVSGIVLQVFPRPSHRVVVAVRFIHRTALIEFSSDALQAIPTVPFKAQNELDALVAPVGNQLIEHLSKHPEDLFKVRPRRFEEIIAELLRDMGYDVFITPETRDGGRDILAAIRLPAADLLTIVECKRYSSDHPIGPDIVQRLMWVADRHDRASTAVVATTSRFTAGAIELQREYKWRLALKDFHSISEWLSRYGTWTNQGKAGIWLSTTPCSA